MGGQRSSGRLGLLPILKRAGYPVVHFNDTLPAFDFIKANGDVPCVITSSMKRGGREEKGLPSGIVLADMITQRYEDCSNKPLLAFITMTADEQEVLERGFSVFVRGDRGRLQHEVLRLLGGAENRDFRRMRSSGACGYKLRDVAREIAEYVCDDEFSRFHSAFADLCFCSTCEPRRVLQRAGEHYALPAGLALASTSATTTPQTAPRLRAGT